MIFLFYSLKYTPIPHKQKEIKRNFLDLVYVSELIDTYKAQCSSGTSTYWHLDVIKINVSKNFN